ncbi:TonB-dependent siderophore receptor [Chryseobacterium lathyri]|uniref:Iron complex outermembrane receptor protein n=1 Tax=Chryseobacterium lathyri TaxID=395933 RepID=A0ABT9SJ75_9FLAO|nr:TonB-dependent receptor [Chryseobacterium lathyri]MDP9958884.1 iron complex outermembrane receptor protein [Chryseobacterium lathyri]
MKNVLICASMLGSMLTFAQEKKDSTNSKNIEEVIINKMVKKLDTESSNKMPVKFIENPQVYSSIDKGILENENIFTVDDAYRNVTGLQKMWNPTGRAGDGGSFFVLRGFPSQASTRNGLVAPVTSTIDAINVETLEFLKGPVGTLYGSTVASYGGLINRVTKKPQQNFIGAVSASAGSYNTYRATADINAPITKNLLFRVNTAYTNEGNFTKTNAGNQYTTFAPSLTWNVSDKVQLNVDYELFQNRVAANPYYFYLSPKTLNEINNMKDLEKAAGLDYKESYTGNDLYMTARNSNIFGNVKWKINDNITSNTYINNSDSYSDGYNPYFSISYDNASSSYWVKRADQSTNKSKKSWFQIQQNFNLNYDFSNGMKNKTVVGFDYMRTTERLRYKYLNTDFDIVAPSGADYSGMNATALTALYADTNKFSTYDYLSDLNTYSGYVSNLFTPIANLHIMAGLRYENNDYLGGMIGPYSKPTFNPAFNQSAFSPKAGIVYEIVPEKFSVFGNYQNSFKSNGYYTYNVAGDMALSDPERGNQFEGGFKASLFKNRFNATISYYNIKVKNQLLNTGEYTAAFAAVQKQAASTLSKGFELEVNAYLVKGFSLVGGLAYNDTVDESTDTRPTTAGSFWNANFNLAYQFVDGKVKGLGFGFGGNYASDNNVTGDFILPKYFVLNANAFYDAKKFRIGVKVDNFTNEHYWTGYSTANPQKLANFLGTIAYKF